MLIIMMLNPALLICISGISFVVWLISRFQISDRNAIIIIFCVAVSLRIIAAVIIDTPIISDFECFYHEAQLFAQGMNLNVPVFGYRVGISVFYGMLLKIWNSALFLKIVNCILASGTAVFVYLLSYKAFDDKKSALFAAAAFTLSPFNILYVTVLNNQLSSLFFVMISLFILWNEKMDDNIRFSTAGFLMGIANVLRSDVLPFVVSILFCLIYSAVSRKGKRIVLFKSIILFLISYFGTNWIVSEAIIRSGINPTGLSNRNKPWKYVVGLNIETRGMWSQKDSELLEQGQITWDFLLTRARGISIKQYAELFIDKLRIFWLGNPNDWSIGHWGNSRLQRLQKDIYQLDAWYWGCIFWGGSVGMFKIMWKNMFQRFSQTFFPICMICTSCVFLVIEVQPRYRYGFSILFFIALSSVYQNIEKLFDIVTVGR